jgi:hypothetical protein
VTGAAWMAAARLARLPGRQRGLPAAARPPVALARVAVRRRSLAALEGGRARKTAGRLEGHARGECHGRAVAGAPGQRDVPLPAPGQGPA